MLGGSYNGGQRTVVMLMCFTLRHVCSASHRYIVTLHNEKKKVGYSCSITFRCL